VNQFIPSDMSWRGWVKMVFHQPLVPVLPVARELFSKTKWIASKGPHLDSNGMLLQSNSTEGSTAIVPRFLSKTPEPSQILHKLLRQTQNDASASLEPSSASASHQDLGTVRPSSRTKMLDMLTRRGSLRSSGNVGDKVSGSNKVYAILTTSTAE
jgi:hypothetical protein